MNCQEFKDLAGALALGALDADERRSAEAHLAEKSHDGCLEALAAAQDAVAELPLALAPVPPREETWDRISSRLSPPVTAIDSRRRRGAPVWVAVAGWTAAAAALVLYFVTSREGDRELADARSAAQTRLTASAGLLDRCRTELKAVRAEEDAQREALALAQLPGARLIAMAPQGDAAQRATALVHLDSGRAVVMGQGLVPQADKDYELWVIRGDQKIAAGLLRAGAEGKLALVVDPKVLAGGVDAFAITLEPAGGGTQPRGPILLVGKV